MEPWWICWWPITLHNNTARRTHAPGGTFLSVGQSEERKCRADGLVPVVEIVHAGIDLEGMVQVRAVVGKEGGQVLIGRQKRIIISAQLQQPGLGAGSVVEPPGQSL